MNQHVTTQTIDQAAERLQPIITRTPLQLSKRLSHQYKAHIYLKREDLQEVRSYKIRGAYNLMSSLTTKEKVRGVVCASAGNHAQGVAHSAALLRVKATIFMPTVTPLQKIDRVKHFGGKWTDIQLVGLTFDEANAAAQSFCEKQNAIFVHPFDDPRTIAGQGTVGKEILEQLNVPIDVVICPIGGGGLVSGVSTYIKAISPKTLIIGAEPKGSPSMYQAIQQKKVVTLDRIDTFVDGAAVKRAGDLTYKIAAKNLDQLLLIDEGKVCTTMIELYQNEGIVAEPAGALTTAALDAVADKIVGKTVICVLSGGNNDILRYPEVLEKSLVYKGLKHYLLIEFAQKPGQLKKFLNEALGPTDDIVRFEYMKKTSKERGPALVGVEVQKQADFQKLCQKMDSHAIRYTIIDSSDPLYSYII